ncbi:MAG TPA: STM4011 family radical SAM protein [Ktedonobacteraceae bacterium]|jgi:MoaA/NifB/PqqE/SkfB family radical SAM enzyme
MKLSILYRGPLSSCNYGCDYCPFAKHRETREEHERDRLALERFLDWVSARSQDQIAIFFTPWGEALVRKRYQDAFVRLSTLPHVTKVAIQTNLSCRLDWTECCDKAKIALWTTYHPSQTSRERFLAKCRELITRDVRFSVGVVGLPEYMEEIMALRKELPQQIYLWINAYKRHPYSSAEMSRLSEIDPLFPLNTRHYPSLGHPCRAGHSVISVDGDGVVRRCHFIKTPIGNLYSPDFEQCLSERLCTNTTCHCHIGYVHMPELQLDDVFGDGILERIPVQPIWYRK